MSNNLTIPNREPDFSVGLPGMNDNCGEQHFWIVECPTAMVSLDSSTSKVREFHYSKEDDALYCYIDSEKCSLVPEVTAAYHKFTKEVEDILLT